MWQIDTHNAGMKRIIVTVIAFTVFGCASVGNFFKSTTSKQLEQAFGDALRSLEGRVASPAQIAGLIMALRVKWLPPGNQWTQWAGKIVQQYLDAHPNNNAEVNAVLEDIALALQK